MGGLLLFFSKSLSQNHSWKAAQCRYRFEEEILSILNKKNWMKVVQMMNSQNSMQNKRKKYFTGSDASCTVSESILPSYFAISLMKKEKSFTSDIGTSSTTRFAFLFIHFVNFFTNHIVEQRAEIMPSIMEIGRFENDQKYESFVSNTRKMFFPNDQLKMLFKIWRKRVQIQHTGLRAEKLPSEKTNAGYKNFPEELMT